jgi:hypothetical protein
MSFLFCFALSEEAELVERAEAGSLLGEAGASSALDLLAFASSSFCF